MIYKIIPKNNKAFTEISQNLIKNQTTYTRQDPRIKELNPEKLSRKELDDKLSELATDAQSRQEIKLDADPHAELRWNRNQMGWANGGNMCTMFGAHHPVCSKMTQHLLNEGWRVIIPRTTQRRGDKSQGAHKTKVEGPGSHSQRLAHGYWGIDEHKSFHIGNTGNLWHKHEVEFDDVDKCRQAIGDSSVVGIFVNSGIQDNQWQDYYFWTNVIIPKTIAKAARLQGVKRVFYFTNLGVDPLSPVQLLRSQWLGEMEVMDEFPEATVFRPGLMVGIRPSTDYYTGMGETYSSSQRNYGSNEHQMTLQRLDLYRYSFNRIPLIDQMRGMRQPVFWQDCFRAAQNALDLPESKGQTQELVGPHAQSIKELQEMAQNSSRRNPDIKQVDTNFVDMWNMVDRASPDYDYTVGSTISRMLNFRKTRKPMLESKQYLAFEQIDMLPTGDCKGFKDLYVKPASIGPLTEMWAGLWRVTEEGKHGFEWGMNNPQYRTSYAREMTGFS